MGTQVTWDQYQYLAGNGLFVAFIVFLQMDKKQGSRTLDSPCITYIQNFGEKYRDLKIIMTKISVPRTNT